jgi:peptidoglycan/LPS O-acetylase OafA/YrhL
MTITTPRRANNPLTRRLPERRYLPELHGIRGLALAGVVLFHLFGNGRVSGGIDIFLAVSGFLFTGMLLREAAASGGRVDPLKYYGRLVRRILVPAALVIAVTLTAGLLISPITKHSQLWAEARASLLYFENIELINSQLAYGAAGPETSPFQHFWSLSVQGQFYIIWPVVAMIAVLIAKRLRTSATRVMAALIGVVFVTSFVYAIYVGSYDQDANYLMTTTRAWQLAFGGLLALAGGTIRLPQPLRAPAGWLGLAMVVTTGFIFNGAQQFPGPLALYPLLGLTLVLISAGPLGGHHDPQHTATRFLSNKPLAWIGDHAYGLYLWHWPLLIFYMELRDRETIGWRGALIILAITIILAMLTYRYIEHPLKARQDRRTSVQATRANKIVVAAAAGALLIAGTSSTVVLNQSQISVADVHNDWDWETYPGAAQTFTTTPLPEAEPKPAFAGIEEHRPEYTKKGCGQKMGNDPGTDTVTVCEDDKAPDHPTATVVLAGGSHAGHLEGAFKTLGQQYGWEVLIVTKSSCVFGWEEEHPEETMCGQWNDNFVQWLQQNKDVDLVVTPGTRLDQPEYILDAAPKWWDKISETGTDLLLVRGTPRGSGDIPACLAEGGTPQECGASQKNLADTNPMLEMDLPDNVHLADVTKYVCPQIENPEADNCDAVVGNVVVWYDNHHFTTPFSQSLAPGFESEMRDTVGWLFD